MKKKRKAQREIFKCCNITTKCDVLDVDPNTLLARETKIKNKMSLCEPGKYEHTLNIKIYYDLLIILCG